VGSFFDDDFLMPQMIGDRAKNVSGELISEPEKSCPKMTVFSEFDGI
jgi:hypothetical protein